MDKNQKLQVTPEKLKSFYKVFVGNIRKDLDAMKTFNAGMQNCLESRAGSRNKLALALTDAGSRCTEAQRKNLENVKQAAKLARELLSFKNTVGGHFSFAFNDGLKWERWSDFTPQEKANSQQMYDNYKKSLEKEFEKQIESAPESTGEHCQIQADIEEKDKELRQVLKFNCKPPLADRKLFKENFVDTAMGDQRWQAKQAYRQIMGNLPILQFVKDGPPSDEQLFQASEEVRKRLEKEDSRIKAIEEKLKTGAELGPEDMFVLGYSTELEKTLITHPEHCKLAAGLLQMKTRDRAKLDGTLLLLTASSMLLPPLGAVVLAGGVSAFFIGRASVEYEQALQSRLTAWDGRQALIPQSDVEAKQNQLVLNLLGTPATLKIASKGAAITGQSLKVLGARTAVSDGTKISPLVNFQRLKEQFLQP